MIVQEYLGEKMVNLNKLDIFQVFFFSIMIWLIVVHFLDCLINGYEIVTKSLKSWFYKSWLVGGWLGEGFYHFFHFSKTNEDIYRIIFSCSSNSFNCTKAIGKIKVSVKDLKVSSFAIDLIRTERFIRNGDEPRFLELILKISIQIKIR